MNNSNIIIFDAYGTLFKLETDRSDLDKILGLKKSEFLNLWRSKLLEYSWLTSLMKNWESFNVIVDKALIHSCKVYKLSYDDLRPVLMNIYKNPELFSDVKSLLVLLNDSGYKCCIMSNGEVETLQNAVANNQIQHQIHKIFSASEVENYKVSPMVYRMATAYFNTGPSKIYFVSSNSWDITGAQYFGYETIWVNRTEDVFDALVEGPNHVVRSLEEIKNIIIGSNS